MSNNLLESVLIEELNSFTATVIVLAVLIGGITIRVLRGNFQANLADPSHLQDESLQHCTLGIVAAASV